MKNFPSAAILGRCFPAPGVSARTEIFERFPIGENSSDNTEVESVFRYRFRTAITSGQFPNRTTIRADDRLDKKVRLFYIENEARQPSQTQFRSL